MKAVHEPAAGQRAMNECDTNADACCLGSNFRILHYTTRVADVYAYDKSISPIENVPIVSGATAWTDSRTNTTYVLVFNESLYYGSKLDHSLINPNQVRHYGIDFWDNPYDKDRGTRIEIDDISIQLQLQGTKLFFETKAPTDDELERCPKIDMTSSQPWEPSTVMLQQTNSTVSPPLRRIAQVQYGSGATYEYLHHDSDEALLHSVSPALVDLREQLEAQIPRNVAQVQRFDDTLEDVPIRQTYTSTDRHGLSSIEVLADRFGIGLERARKTLRVTTQRGTRSALLPLSRRYKADRHYDVKQLRGKFATDTIYFKTKSLNGNFASQIYSHKCGFSACYHMKKANGESVGGSLRDFVSDYGRPDHLTYDGAAVQTGKGTDFHKTARKHEIRYHVSAPRRPNENPAEGAIREIKRRWYRLQSKHNVPDRLWDFGLSYTVETGNIISNLSKYSDERTPIEIITGDTPEISEYLDFGFYEWVTFRQNAGLGQPELGKWLGVSHRIGRLMSYWILPESGIPISCTTVQRVTIMEKQTAEFQNKAKRFEEGLEPKWAAMSADLSSQITDIEPRNLVSIHDEDPEFIREFTRVIDSGDVPEAEDLTSGEIGTTDPYLGMELGIRRDEEDTYHARVKRRKTDAEGKPVGTAHNNPLLDSREYEIEYIDGRIETMTANLIAENLLAQVDDEGHRHLLIDEIEDHKALPEAIPKDQGTYVAASGLPKPKRTTRGWILLVRWRDGSSNWTTLKDLKDSYPVQLADYAVANGIQDEPAFAWWVPYVRKKRTAIIQKIKSKYWQRTHKYGIKIPKNIAEAERIDKENGNHLWMDSIRLEMKNNRVAFETYNGNIADLVGYTEITGHIVFDVKLAENFRRKARYCADGHKVDTPPFLTYSTVVARDSVRIILLAAALNDLDLQGADIQNAFLSAPNLEKHWLRAGPEFGSEQGKVFLVVRALYGLKSAGAAFRSFMAKRLDEIGFKSSIADPDVWLRPAMKESGEEHYEYIVMYVDDILCASQNAKSVLRSIEGNTIKYKNDKIEPPAMYLGGRLQKKSINDTECWTITSVDYINAAISTVEEALKNRPYKLPTKARTPMTLSYLPELDDTPELESDDVQFYQEMMGMLRWATELGKVDMLHELSLLSQYQANPRQGHMAQALHIFAYLKNKPKTTLYMNPEEPNISYSDFKAKADEFKEYYRDAEEEMPHKMPKPRGVPVITTAFCDSSHAANKKTRRSHTGYVTFVNRAPIKWISRRQNTVETSAFSSEFIALKQCIEDIEHLRFKLRMFGIPIAEEHPTTYIYCDNEGVVKNATRVDSTLNKKHSEVAYHFTRWNVTAKVCSLAWIETGMNIADAFTKRLSDAVREFLFGEWTY